MFILWGASARKKKALIDTVPPRDHRVGPPLAAVGPQRVLRQPAVLPGQRGAGGRRPGAGRLDIPARRDPAVRVTTRTLHGLRAAADRYWEAFLEARPTEATLHGDHRYDDRIEDVSVDADARQRATWLEIRAAVEAIDPAGLDPAGRVTQELLRAELTDAVEAIDVREIELRFDQNTAVHAELFVVAPQIKAPTPESARALLERHRQIPALLDQVVDRLRAGLAAGRTPARINIERSLNQIDKYLASPLDGDPFTTLAGPPDWDGEAAWRAELADRRPRRHPARLRPLPGVLRHRAAARRPAPRTGRAALAARRRGAVRALRPPTTPRSTT